MFVATILPLPSQLVNTPSSSLLQQLMISGISKTFECQFESSFIRELLTLNSIFDSLVEATVSNLLASDNHFETIKDISSYFMGNSQQLVEAFPFKEQLVEILSNIADCTLIANLPIIKVVSAITATFKTVIIGIAYMETLKIYKTATYTDKPLPDIKEILLERMKLKYQQLGYFFTRKTVQQF
jgi:hypothetical protein